MFLVIMLIAFAAALVLMMVSTAICKVTPDFTRTANMLTAAFMPSAILFAISIVTSYIFVLISAVLMAAAYVCFVVLAYLGMQKMSKFEKSPFKIYVVFIVLLVIIVSLVGGKISVSFVQEALSGLKSSLMSSLLW